MNNKKDNITAFYFHGDFRCMSCRKIEQYSEEAIKKYFSKQIGDGVLTFKIINTDQKENKHFIKDYQLYTKSLVIVMFKDGRQVKWKNLSNVWSLLNDRDAFFSYVREEVQKYYEEL